MYEKVEHFWSAFLFPTVGETAKEKEKKSS